MASFTTISSDTNFATSAILGQIDSAINERSAAFGIGSTLSTPVGTNIQAHTYWSTRQAAIDLIVQTCLTGSRYFTNSTNLEGSAASVVAGYTSTAGFWGKINSGATGPIRRTSTPTGAKSYGYCQSGDIIDAWLVTDLQAACRYMNRVVYRSTGASNHTLTKWPYNNNGYGVSGIYTNDFFPIFYVPNTYGDSASQSVTHYNNTASGSFLGNQIGNGWETVTLQHSGYWLQNWSIRTKNGSTHTIDGRCEGGNAILAGMPSVSKTIKVYSVAGAISPGITIDTPPSTEGPYNYNFRCLNHTSTVNSSGLLVKVGEVATATVATSQTVYCLGDVTNAKAETGTPLNVVPYSTTQVYGYQLPWESYWLISFNWAYS